MPRAIRCLVVLVSMTGAFLVGEASAQQHDPQTPFVRRSPSVETLAGFVENRGQWDAEVLYFGRLNGIEATLTRDAIVLMPQRDAEAAELPLAPLVIRLPGAAAVEGVGILPTAHHYILGTGTTSWVPGFAEVVYRDVVPGIDLVVREGAEWFAYDVHVDAGVDLSDLVLGFENASSVGALDGVLVMETPSGRVEQLLGAAWEIDPATDERVPVSSRFQLLTTTETTARVGLQSPSRDPTRSLVIDPSLVWATYVGGTGQELVMDVDVAPSGAVYLAAKSNSTGPTTPGAFQTVKPGGSNPWVGKLSADGSSLEWATFIGGSTTEDVLGLAVDAEGAVTVLGDTWSSDFPTTAGAFQPVFAGANDIFVSRLTPDGSELVWSTFFGGVQNDHARALQLFADGDVLFSGDSETDEPPATAGVFDAVYDAGDRFLARLSSDTSQLVFKTYFDSGNIYLALGPDESIYLGGSAGSNLPATPGAFKETMAQGDTSDGFVAKMDSMGTTLYWATHLGGDAQSETVPGIAVDAAGAVYVAGLTGSSDFPVTPGAFDTSLGAPDSGFVAKLLPSGTGLVWSSYIGGCCTGTSQMFDIAVDRAGNAISVGSSNEPNFPTTPDAFQPTYIGNSGMTHLTKFDAFGEVLVYSTYFGGSSSTDYVPHLALDAADDPCMVLWSGSNDIPVTPGVYDPTFNGSTDIVVAKFDLDLAPCEVLGGALAGSLHAPNLAGGGALTTGSPARFSVRGAAALAPASIVAGVSAANLPFKKGTMVPFPSIVLSLVTDSQGALDIVFNWPGVPAGINVWVQVWMKDVGAPTGFSATNALKMTAHY